MRDRRLKQLLRRYSEHRDPKAIARLFDAVAPELLAVARPVVGAGAEAEDLVQATFLVVLEHPERHDPEREVMPWLVGILTREARYWRRRSARRPDPARLGFEDDSSTGPREPQVEPMPESGASRSELEGLVRKALARVPALYREVLSRHLHEGLDPADIARELDRSAVTVRVQLHRGMARLRQLLPAGVTGGLALALAPRGLAQVRSELLLHANSLAPAAVAGGAVSLGTLAGGLLVAHKVTFAVLVAGLVGLVLFMLPDEVAGAPQFQGAGELSLIRAVDLQDGRVEEVGSRRDVASSGRADQAGASGRSAEFYPLVVHVNWADGEPASAVGLDLLAVKDGVLSGARRFVRTGDDGAVQVSGLRSESYLIYADRGRSKRVDLRPVTRGDDGGASDPRDGQITDAMTTHITIVLREGHDVKGRVVDSDGRAVAGAVLWINNELTRSRNREIGRADADGRFVLKQLADDCFLGARAPGFAPTRPIGVERLLKVSSSDAALEVELRMPSRGAALSGSVLDSVGRPVAGARVRIGAQGGFDTFGPEGPAGPPPPIEVLTDSEGQFRAQGLALGVVGVSVKAEGHPIWAGHSKLSPGAAGQLSVVLEQGAWVRGRIEFEGGVAAPNIEVRVMDIRRNGRGAISSFAQPETRSDEDGRYRLGPLSAGEVSLYAATASRKETARMQFVAVAACEYDWQLTLRGLPSIGGVAVDGQGNALVGWVVVARYVGLFGLPTVSATTDDAGEFRLQTPAVGSWRLELFEGPRLAASAPVSWLDGVAAGAKDVRMVLDPHQAPTARLQGRLTMATGALSPRTAITVDHERFGRVAELELPAGQAAFDIARLPAGKVELRIEPVGCGVIRLDDLLLEAGVTRRLDDTVLQRAGSMAVTVERWDGQVFENLNAELVDAAGRSCYLRRSSQGFTRDSLAPGLYRLSLSASACERRSYELRVVAGEALRKHFRLAAGASCGFVMLDAKGQLLGEAVQLKIKHADGRLLVDRQLKPSPRGATSLWERLPMGTHSVTAQAADGRRARLSFVVGSSQPIGLRLR